MSENDNVSPDYITMLIHTTPTDMLSDSLARTCLQAAVRRLLAQMGMGAQMKMGAQTCLQAAVRRWIAQMGMGGDSARSSQWSDDDDTYTCNGDSCEFQGTLAEVIEHENQCEQMIEKLGLPTEAEMETEADTGPETEMSQAETDTE